MDDDPVPSATRAEGGGGNYGEGGVFGSEEESVQEEFGTDEGSSDVELLRIVWRNEKSSPEILPYESSLVERIQEQIMLMEDNIEAFATEISDELMLSLYRMDVSRTVFLLRSYLRTRISKIERHAMYIVETQELWERLSDNEQEYAKKFCEIFSKHMEQSVLSRLPSQYGSISKQTASNEESDMIPKPQLDTFVFCRSREAIGSFQLDEKGDETVDLMTNDLYILRYKPVRKLLEANRIELI